MSQTFGGAFSGIALPSTMLKVLISLVSFSLECQGHLVRLLSQGS